MGPSPRARWSHLKEDGLVFLTSSPGGRLDDAAVGAALEPAGLKVGGVLWPEEMDSANRLKLSVPLYRESQVGAASRFGPVKLDTILSFCKELSSVLTEHGPKGVVCVACTGKPGALANSLLLVGAFLLLERGRSFKDVAGELFAPELGVSARGMRFPRPWTSEPQWSGDSLSVEDCLLGLEAALEHEWFDYGSHDPTACRNVLNAYDAVRVCTVHVAADQADGGKACTMTMWVAADPVTTVKDPHARPDPPDGEPLTDNVTSPSSGKIGTPTFSGQLAGGRSPSSMVSRSSLRVRNSKATVGSSTLEIDPVEEWLQHAPSTPSTVGNLIRRSFSKAKLGPQKPVAAAPPERPADLPTFARWLRDDLRCQLIVRANHSNEPNLPAGSYGDFFSRWGVEQLDVPFTDGTAPPNRAVVTVVSEVSLVLSSLSSSARPCSVVVHCKSGFGRSMSMIGALAVSLTPGLSAGAYFGWARLVRPGSIQTAEQERFLRALDEGSPCGGCPCFRASPTKP